MRIVDRREWFVVANIKHICCYKQIANFLISNNFQTIRLSENLFLVKLNLPDGRQVQNDRFVYFLSPLFFYLNTYSPLYYIHILHSLFICFKTQVIHCQMLTLKFDVNIFVGLKNML